MEVKLGCEDKFIVAAATRKLLIKYPDSGPALILSAGVKVALGLLSRLNQSSSCNDRN